MVSALVVARFARPDAASAAARAVRFAPEQAVL